MLNSREAPADAPEGDGRYHRQTLIEWWDQSRVSRSRFLVIGAGALGNEVLKLLALMGAGKVLAYDMDRIERSNLSRSVLFRDEDEGAFKASVAVRRMRELNPGISAVARDEDVIQRGGLGVFFWADVVLGAVDNREARIFVNSACARAGRRWVDGAIEGLSGVVRVFDPARGPCYECTMNAVDRKLVAERRSCALLARDVVLEGHVPATAVAASVIGALQVQEALKILHGQPSLSGEGLHIDGLHDQVSRVAYPRREDCTGHERLPPPVRLGIGSRGATWEDLLRRAEERLGSGAVIDLSRDVVVKLGCPRCGSSSPGKVVLGGLKESQARCPGCGAHRVVETASTVSREGGIDLAATPADLGLPPFDVVVARRGVEDQEAWLFDGDGEVVLGPLAGEGVETGPEPEREASRGRA